MPDMQMRVLALALTVALAPASLVAQETEAATQAKPPSLTTYGWKAPSSAIVTEDVTKKGESSQTRYRLDITPREGGGICIAYEDFRFLQFHDMDMESPQVQKVLETITAMTAAIPDLHVHADGRFGEASGVDECIDTVVEFMAKMRGMGPAEKKRLRAAMRTPAATAMMKEGVAQYWRTWVGAWHGWTLEAGEKHTEKKQLQLLGKGREATVHTEHLPAPADHPGCVALKMVIESEPAHFGMDAAFFIAELVPKVQAAGGIAAGEDRLELSYHETLTVITDPKTMLTKVATSDRTITLHDSATEETHEQVEKHRYQFDWKGAESRDK
jgi:hypothetical protein